MKFLRDLLRRLDPRIAHRDDLHIGQRLESRQMPMPHDASRADDADPQFFGLMLGIHSECLLPQLARGNLRRPAAQCALMIYHLPTRRAISFRRRP